MEKKRIGILSEIEGDVCLNSSMLKKICGDETLPMRALFSSTIQEVRLYTKIFFIGNNLPRYDADDETMNRRIVIIPFDNHFVDNPTPGTNERLMDHTLKSRIEEDELL
jgi:phage/plasmid-associated DNA primase